MRDNSEKGGTTSCATSCAPCGEAETLFPTDDERTIDRLRARIAELEARATEGPIVVPGASQGPSGGRLVPAESVSAWQVRPVPKPRAG